MIDRTEKPKIPSKFAKRAARYNEFGFNISNVVRHCFLVVVEFILRMSLT